MQGFASSLLLQSRARLKSRPIFAKIALHHGFSTTAMNLVGRYKPSATIEPLAAALEVQDQADTVSQSTQEETRRPLPPDLTSFSQIFHSQMPWLVKQVASGYHIPSRLLAKVLHHRRISTEQFQLWVDVLSRGDVYYSLVELGLLDSLGHFGHHREDDVPDWLLLVLPDMINGLEDVPYIVNLLLNSDRFRTMEPKNRSIFISACLKQFLTVRHLVAARELVEWFCQHQLGLHEQNTFSRLLEALAEGTFPGRRDPTTLSKLPNEFVGPLQAQLSANIGRLSATNGVELPESLLGVTAASLITEQFVEPGATLECSALEIAPPLTMNGSATGGNDVKTTLRIVPRSKRRKLGRRGLAMRRLRAQSVPVCDPAWIEAMFLRNMQGHDREGQAMDTAFMTFPFDRLFAVMAKMDQMTARDLIEYLQRLERANISLSDHSLRRVYHSVMHGLLLRFKPDLVIRLWDLLPHRGIQPDSYLLDLFIRAESTINGTERARMQYKLWLPRITTDEWTGNDAVPLNNLMTRARRSGKYDQVYRTFITMRDEFGVVPDWASLTMLLQAARRASFNHSTKWDNQDPGVFATQVFMSMLEQNWPEEAKTIGDPAASTGVIDWIVNVSKSASSKSYFVATLNTVDPPSYPYLCPTQRSFHALILLLGSRVDFQKVPLVLAWMRRLDIKPLRYTLTLAMLQIGEMALRDKELGKWRAWLVDWLGDENVPDENEIASARRRGADSRRGLGRVRVRS